MRWHDVCRSRHSWRRLASVVVLSVAVAGLAVVGGATAAAPPAAAQQDIPVRPADLDPDPVLGGGVVGFAQPSVAGQSWRVHAFAQIGNRIYVGGAFTQVRERPWSVSPTHDQPFLAAFDLVTNNWISTFRPTFDAPVWSLETRPDGTLLVGGEFTRVNGTARTGLVALDATTGAVVPSFRASIANDGSSSVPSVRALQIVGNDLYVAGSFNRLVVEGGDRNGVYDVARVSVTDGAWDRTFLPRSGGGGVFDVAVDAARGKVHLVGTFTSMNASPSTNGGAAVSITNGATLAGHAFETNNRGNKTYGVAMLGNQVWQGGEQHFLQVRDAASYTRLGCFVTGTGPISGAGESRCTSYPSGGGGGGDYQVVEAIDGFVVGGCHCRANHYNSFTGQNTNLDYRAMRAYAPDGTELPFYPNTTYWSEGPYAAFGDSRGCLYVGGDFTGNVDGFARFCPDLGPDVTPPSSPGSPQAAVNGSTVTLTWGAATDDIGVAGYLVHRDYQFVAWVPSGTTYTDANVGNGPHRYDIRAQDAAGNNSAPATVQAQVGTADTQAPSTPPNPQASVNGSTVTLTWGAATDNVGVAGYLVHRDWQFVAWVPTGTTYTDANVAPGPHRYDIRAQDRAGNNSAPATVQATVG